MSTPCLLLGGCLALYACIKALVSRRMELAYACLPLNKTIVKLHQQFNNLSLAGQWIGGNYSGRGAGSHTANRCSRPLKSHRCLTDKRNHNFMKRACPNKGMGKQRKPRPLGEKQSRGEGRALGRQSSQTPRKLGEEMTVWICMYTLCFLSTDLSWAV